MLLNYEKLTGMKSTRIHTTFFGKKLVIVTVQVEGQREMQGQTSVCTAWRDATEEDLSNMAIIEQNSKSEKGCIS